MILYRTTKEGVREEVLDPSLDDLKDSVILSGSFNPLHEGHVKLLEHSLVQTGRKQIIFELAIVNADKGAIDDQLIERRLNQFESRGLNLLITTQPYFYKKALMLPDQHFALGYDTFVRLLDLKYYEGSSDKLLEILRWLDAVGTKFLVAGRLNQAKNLFEYLDEDALNIVPMKYLHMFQAVKDFRVDLSSTELR